MTILRIVTLIAIVVLGVALDWHMSGIDVDPVFITIPMVFLLSQLMGRL